MTNTAFTAAPSNSSDASFRLWGSAISAGLTAAGMVQTADTGQVNWATVARAGSANTEAGYEVWRFNDTLQATAPIFLRLGYGSGSSAGYPRITVNVGSATNGSGTLSGTGSGTQLTPLSPPTSDGVARDCWVSSDGSGLAMALFNNASSATVHVTFFLERFRDTSGVASNKGFWFGYQNNAAKQFLFIDLINSVAISYPLVPCLVPFVVTGGTSFLDSSSNVMAFPWYAATKEGIFGSKMVLSYAFADLGYDSQQAVTHLGASRTFRSLGGNAAYSDVTANVNITSMIWWSD